MNHLRDLVGMQEAIAATARMTVNSGRAEAKMPPVPQDMMEAALQNLSAQYSEAFVSGVMTLQDGAEFLADLVTTSGKDITSRVIFLRQCAAGWERATTGKLSDYMELAEPLEAKLKTRPDISTANDLNGLIKQFALTTRPPREAAQLLGLEHEPSTQAVRRWQLVALDLNNRLDAVPEAVLVFEALESGFGTSEELGRQVTRNLAICRDRLAAGEGSPEMKRLSKALDRASLDPAAFNNSGTADGTPRLKSPGVVLELRDSFVAATTEAASDRPWLLLRAFSLRLHNEHSATRAALSLTEMAVCQGKLSSHAAAILPMLLEDRRSLREQVLRAEFEAAALAKKRGLMRQILFNLIPVAENPIRRKDYEATLSKLQRQAIFQYLRWSFWPVVGLLMFIVASTNDKQSGPHHTQVATHQELSNVTVPAPPLTTRDISKETIQPVAGTANLLITGLRWCRFQKVRVDGAEAFLDKIRDAPGTDAAHFNAAVAAYNAYIQPYNASCGTYSYRKSDAAIVDAELNERSAALETDGRIFALEAYSSAVPAASQLLVVPPAYQPPAAYVPPQASLVEPPTSLPLFVPPTSPVPQSSRIDPWTVMSAAYGDGQADRRAWEAWMGSLTGSIHDGAEWWSGVRSSAHPPSCTAVPSGIDPPAAVSGCNQAKIRLGRTDARRRAEPDYRAGWNNP